MQEFNFKKCSDYTNPGCDKGGCQNRCCFECSEEEAKRCGRDDKCPVFINIKSKMLKGKEVKNGTG